MKYQCEDCKYEKFNIKLERTYLISICINCGTEKIWN